jgi:CubicO group peptidase (beta-lactamase class C family)
LKCCCGIVKVEGDFGTSSPYFLPTYAYLCRSVERSSAISAQGITHIASYIKIAIATLTTLALWTTVVVGGVLLGWWRQPLAPPGDSASFMRAAIKEIDEGKRGNAAFMLIENGAIRGEYYTKLADSVDRDTVFATASMSKWITALGVMKLVQEERLELDRPVEEYLSRWHLPPSQFDHRGVTVRRLLAHTAGLTDGLGFGEYHSDESLPSLEQSLTSPRASSGEPVIIAVGIEPGSRWQYSGGGYLLLELLIEEASGERFETFISRAILQPLNMTHSGYHDLDKLENSAKSYDARGSMFPHQRYASKAATGFNTTAGDMAKLIMAHFPATGGKPQEQSWLAQPMLDAMRQPHGKVYGMVDIWGLGTMLYAPTSNGDFVFGHDGSNEPAINVSVRINPDHRDGFIMLETGNKTLATRLGSEWVFWQTGTPDFLDIPEGIQSVIPVWLGGAFVILLAGLIMTWRCHCVRELKKNPSTSSISKTP